VTDEINYRILKLLEAKPDISQRDMAKDLGVSLGKTNYCLKAMLEKGWIKAKNFKNSHNKIAYSYLLTPTGIENKTKITIRFLKRKMQEYDALKYEIERLQREINIKKDGARNVMNYDE
jgi:EPS-associated MarR family transcriptional regulator